MVMMMVMMMMRMRMIYDNNDGDAQNSDSCCKCTTHQSHLLTAFLTAHISGIFLIAVHIQ